MAKENKTLSSRERLLARARERFPDRTFPDIGAEPQDGAADLDDAITEMVEDLLARKAKSDESNSKLTSLIATDPSAAEFLYKWIESGDPRAALVETFGDELGMSEEARKGFQDQLASWRERKSKNDALNAEAQANWEASLTALNEWGDAHGLSAEQKRDVMLRLLSIAFNGMENKYFAEDFDLAYRAMNHDNDVAAARQEGEVAGRNAKIASTRRERSAAAAMPPAPTGRQGGSVRERRPKKESFWGEVNKGV